MVIKFLAALQALKYTEISNYNVLNIW